MNEPGEMVADRFRITATLGEGGFGTTWSAHDTQTDQLVALKQLSLEHVEDWKSVELFEREAAVLESLDHPQIPDYVDFIEANSGGGGYIVQTLAPGTPLSKLLEQGKTFTEEECLEIARQVLGILDYLASRNPPVVHRDIKPANLIMDQTGTVRLVDFGAVRQLAAQTVSGSTMVGTLGYMAPEQLQGEATIGSDIYGLGMTLIHLLTGRDPASLPKRRLKVDFKDRVEVAPAFEFVIDQMIETVPEDRIGSPAEALKLLGGVTAMVKVDAAPTDDELDAMVQQRKEKLANLRAKAQRASLERQAELARAREKLAAVTRIETDADGFLLAHDPSLWQRLTPERWAGVLVGGGGATLLIVGVVLSILAGWHPAIVINLGVWGGLFAAGGIWWFWYSLAAMARERVFIRVNPSDNFMIYRREGKPLAYGPTSELSLTVWEARPDDVHGGAMVRAAGHETRLGRLSGHDVKTMKKFAELTKISD